MGSILGIWFVEWINFTSNHVGRSFSCPLQEFLYSVSTWGPNTRAAECKPMLLSNKALHCNEMAQILSTNDCLLDQDTNENEATDEGSEDELPMIDVFLNPGREMELEEMLERVEMMEANLIYSEVLNGSTLFTFFILRKSFPESIPTCSVSFGPQHCPAPKTQVIQARPTCSSSAPGKARWSTAQISSPRSSPTPGCAALST